MCRCPSPLLWNSAVNEDSPAQIRGNWRVSSRGLPNGLGWATSGLPAQALQIRSGSSDDWAIVEGPNSILPCSCLHSCSVHLPSLSSSGSTHGFPRAGRCTSQRKLQPQSTFTFPLLAPGARPAQHQSVHRFARSLGFCRLTWKHSLSFNTSGSNATSSPANMSRIRPTTTD